MPGHKHRRLRQAHQNWDNFVRGVENVANELNPFKDAHHTVEVRSPQTVFKTIFTTMSKTFDGPIGGYSTVTDHPETRTANSASDVTADSSKETAAPRPDPQVIGISDGLPKSLVPSESFNLNDEGSTLAAVTGTPTIFQSQASTSSTPTGSLGLTGAAALASPTSSPETSKSTSSNSAATAGIVIGVLGGILALGLLIFFLFRKRRKQQPHDDEKVGGALPAGHAGSVPPPISSMAAPQLSLRPVTQFNPTFNERRSSMAVGMMLATAGENRAAGAMRPSTANSTNPQNPFNDSARASSPTGSEHLAAQGEASNPFDSPENVVGMAQGAEATATTGNGEGSVAVAGAATVSAEGAAVAAAAAAGAAAAGAALARKESIRKQAPETSDSAMSANPPTSTGSAHGIQPAGAGQSQGPVVVGAAAVPPPSPVHRVQLDFKPSMDDELEIQAGHLVRILHEYDDGWALCIRLDRSQQGVVPRTCLSTRPVKPRPAGGPPAPRNGPPRGPGPFSPGPYGRPQSPAHMRPYSPAGARPMTPSSRVQSPGPHQQHPQSPNGMNRRYTPPGRSPMSPQGSPGAAQQYHSPPSSPPQAPIDPTAAPGQAY